MHLNVNNLNLSEEISRLRLEISHLKEKNKHLQKHVPSSYSNTSSLSSTDPILPKTLLSKAMQHSPILNPPSIYPSQPLHKHPLPKRSPFPIQKGMFSMKKPKVPATKSPNPNTTLAKLNSSLLSQGLQFLDDNESLSIQDSDYPTKHNTSNKTTNSSINLNKYKIVPSSSSTNPQPQHSTSASRIRINLNKQINSPPRIIETAHFDNKPLHIRESRRMLIEYIKTSQMMTPSLTVSNALAAMHISSVVLQQRMNQQRNVNVSTIKEGGDGNERTSMLNYLSVPRLMSLIKEDEREVFMFLLSPTFSSFCDGKERYLFRWVDLKERLIKGGFDVGNVVSCELKEEDGNVFKVEVGVDGSERKVYDIEASTKEMCYNYIMAINYMKRKYSRMERNLK